MTALTLAELENESAALLPKRETLGVKAPPAHNPPPQHTAPTHNTANGGRGGDAPGSFNGNQVLTANGNTLNVGLPGSSGSQTGGSGGNAYGNTGGNGGDGGAINNGQIVTLPALFS